MLGQERVCHPLFIVMKAHVYDTLYDVVRCTNAFDYSLIIYLISLTRCTQHILPAMHIHARKRAQARTHTTHTHTHTHNIYDLPFIHVPVTSHFVCIEMRVSRDWPKLPFSHTWCVQ